VAVVGLRMHKLNSLAPKPPSKPNSPGRIPVLPRCDRDKVNLATGATQFVAEHSKISQAQENRMEWRWKVTRNHRSEILGSADRHADETVRYPQFPKAKSRCGRIPR
jgi:hypothetical protein